MRQQGYRFSLDTLPTQEEDMNTGLLVAPMNSSRLS
jgi:hypothetical protein